MHTYRILGPYVHIHTVRLVSGTKSEKYNSSSESRIPVMAENWNSTAAPN